MENATKGLMIAGAILIAIVLIGIGVFLVSQAKNFTDAGAGKFSEMEVSSFNQKFEQYEGKKKGSEVKSLLTTINSNNMKAVQDDLKDEKTVYVLFENGSEISEPSDIIAVRNQVNSGKNYTVTIEYNEKSSLVSKVTIALTAQV